MNRLALLLALLLPTLPALASTGGGVGVKVQYYKVGTEPAPDAEKLGQREVDFTNPCVVAMKQEAEKWANSSADFKDALAQVKKKFAELDPPPQPVLVLRYMNDSMEFVFEMRIPAVLDLHNKLKAPEKTVYRKWIMISGFRGSWKDRIDRHECRLGDDREAALVDQLREADRLAACMERKKELLSASQKVSNYIHHYLPEDWIRDALQKISEEDGTDDKPNSKGVLREDTLIYRQGNESYKECSKGLRLLEAEATESARVLEEVRSNKEDTPLPTDDIRKLEKVLNEPAPVKSK